MDVCPLAKTRWNRFIDIAKLSAGVIDARKRVR